MADVKVLVCGSRLRGFGDGIALWDAVYDRLAQLPTGAHVIHGGASGTDEFAHRAASLLGLKVTRYKADWETHGKRAGILRNLEMLDQQPDYVIAFWDGASRGTQHTIDEARRRGIHVEVHRLVGRDGG